MINGNAYQQNNSSSNSSMFTPFAMNNYSQNRMGQHCFANAGAQQAGGQPNFIQMSQVGIPPNYQGIVNTRSISGNSFNQLFQGPQSSTFNFRKDHGIIHKKENGEKEEMQQRKLMVIEGVEEGTKHLKHELIQLTQKAITDTMPKILSKCLPNLLREKLTPVL